MAFCKFLGVGNIDFFSDFDGFISHTINVTCLVQKQIRISLFFYGGEKGIRVIAKRASLLAKAKRLRSTICCKQQCYAFVRQIAQSLAMSAALDFRKCKRLLLSSLAVSR